MSPTPMSVARCLRLLCLHITNNDHDNVNDYYKQQENTTNQFVSSVICYPFFCFLPVFISLQGPSFFKESSLQGIFLKACRQSKLLEENLLAIHNLGDSEKLGLPFPWCTGSTALLFEFFRQLFLRVLDSLLGLFVFSGASSLSFPAPNAAIASTSMMMRGVNRTP